ncbi:asparagine--tRNA ligase [Thermoplasma sp. Kam2015]|uniref:asparagine--tRNA ligase n=1 Tax=Thermoplasma sp. Kam2015 TaxID=2094122 RepID=UPI000D83F87C|nr:asparagine--tRNA ligase [Thermoplasma sp. Kam2015]PYB68758.1 asparagine--tRNA ligase [Thermoplasma sp. Kam2015]
MLSIAEVSTKAYVGSKVAIRGWVYRIRSSGGVTFVVVRDSSGIIQCTARKNELQPDVYDSIASLGIESSVEFHGTLKEDRRSPSGYELAVDSCRIYQKNDVFPITKDQGEEFLLDNRHLWLRSREFTSILKVRSTIFRSFADFFYENGYYQVQTPFMVSTAVEGGSTLFKVDFFGEPIFLNQSAQFYLETMIYSLEKVFTIAPSFRAEKSRTRRHLTEYWHAEAEVAWIDNNEMMDIEERMIYYIISRVIEDNEDDLRMLGRDPDLLKGMKPPYPRIRYSEIIKTANSIGLALKYGDDLGADEERQITMKYDRPIFVTNYPKELKPFYMPVDPENPGEVLNHDMLAPEGYGEIIGGSQRIWNYDEMMQRIREANLDEKAYYWYIDLRKYGSVPHSGFGLGLDRLAMWIMHLDNIREAIPYPRTIRRTRP